MAAKAILRIPLLLCGMVVAAAAGFAAETGRIDGRIVLSPAMPVSRVGEANERPMAGQVAVVDQRGTVAVQVASDQTGNFHVDLPPGHYTLRLESSGRIGRSSPVEVTVTAGHVTETVVTVDSGIR
jgi:hypothetical protein